MPSTRGLDRLRRLGRALAGIALAVPLLLGVYAVATAPPPATPVPASDWTPRPGGAVVRGVYHVHTTLSDGSGSFDSVAAAAARAGLDFLIFTDHGDATRVPEPPRYRSGVLCLDAVEISTAGGHYAALGLPSVSYPLAGEADAVVEDVARLGGLGIATHPDSPKRALQWRNWDLPIDAFEWLNADTEWRTKSRTELARAALHYAVRGPETIASMFERPVTTLARWDRAGAAGRRLVVVAGADAHARLGPRGSPDDDERGETDEAWSLPLPSYESVLRSLSLRVEIDHRFTADPVASAAALLGAIRRGRVFTVIDGYATPGAFEFFAETPSGIRRMGEVIARDDGPVRLRARAAAPAGATIVLVRDGVPVARGTGLALDFVVPRDGEEATGMFRVEVVLPRHGPREPAPWILSNAIYVSEPGAPPSASPRSSSGGGPPGTGATPADRNRVEAVPLAPEAWRAEHDPESTVTATRVTGAAAPALAFAFSLAAGRGNAWAAIVHELASPVGERATLALAARASHPLRVSVQVRVESPDADLRWRRSVYLDPTPRTIEVPLEAMRPVTRAVPASRLGEARSLLLVIDRTNTAGGTSGTVWIDGLRLVRAPGN